MTFKDIIPQLADWSEYLVVLVAVMSLFTIKNNSFFRLLAVYLFVLSGLQIATKVTADLEIHNAYLYHLIGAVEMSFIFLLHRLLGLKFFWNWIFLMVLLLYVFDSCWMIVLQEDKINSFGQALGMLFIIVLGFHFLWKLYQNEKVVRLDRYPYFYINAGFTLFGAGAFFGYLFIASFTENEVPEENFYYSWMIVSVFSIIKLTFISIGIFKARNYEQ